MASSIATDMLTHPGHIATGLFRQPLYRQPALPSLRDGGSQIRCRLEPGWASLTVPDEAPVGFGPNRSYGLMAST
jgi:hypothetical protein